MKKIWNYIISSNRYKHIIGGALVAIPFSVLSGLYCSIIAGVCLEYKDKAYGNKFDWIDLLFTILGGAITTIVKLFV